MKSDITKILNKLVAYALDNLLLDALDAGYMLNRLASACGVPAFPLDADADYQDNDIAALLDELEAVMPNIDKAKIGAMLFPMPRTVNYYLESKLARSADKGFDFLFDLFAHGYNSLSKGQAVGKGGFLCYPAACAVPFNAALDVGEPLAYTPIAEGNRIAVMHNLDILSDDAVAREAEYVSAYGGAIAVRIGNASDYYCCKDIALTSAATKAQLATGTVKVTLLDYPVPALAFNGIAKNAVAREVTRVIKLAADNSVPLVAAAAAKDGITFYLVFANDIACDANGFITGSDALAACGVFPVKDCAPLLSVLRKGTALSTDLAEFKPIYDTIGGVKHGDKAEAALGSALVDIALPLLKAAASADENTVSGYFSQA